MRHRRRSRLHAHSLSLLLGTMVLALLLAYWRADRTMHLGSFYANAAADWMVSFVTVVATTFWFERGSPESRVPSMLPGSPPRFLREHSLTVVLGLTWIGVPRI